MAKKYYAVRKGLTPGIYTDWNTCKDQISGFPGAEYKGFNTLSEAEEFLGRTAAFPSANITSDENDVPVPAEGTAIAYVDGSFKESSGKFSYGVIMFIHAEGSDEITELRLNKAFSNPELLEMRNVSGEIMGSAQAMKEAASRGLKEIVIFHDYEGIAKWCTGDWKANKVWTKKYKAFYDEISGSINIIFKKVKGHSGDKYNDIADELAKAALEE